MIIVTCLKHIASNFTFHQHLLHNNDGFRAKWDKVTEYVIKHIIIKSILAKYHAQISFYSQKICIFGHIWIMSTRNGIFYTVAYHYLSLSLVMV